MPQPVEMYLSILLQINDAWQTDPEFRRSEAFDVLYDKADKLWDMLTREERDLAALMLKETCSQITHTHLNTPTLLPRKHL